MRKAPEYQMMTESGLDITYVSPKIRSIKQMRNDEDLSQMVAVVEEMVKKVMDGGQRLETEDLTMEDVVEIFLHWTGRIEENSKRSP